MIRPHHDLHTLLAQLDPQADLAHRHLWLIAVMDWLRGNASSVPDAVGRLGLLLDAVQARPEVQSSLQAWWQTLMDTVDITPLLADFGFAPRTALLSELTERLRLKILPASPETIDATELFTLVLPKVFDAQWLAALPADLLERLMLVLCGDNGHSTHWQHALLDAMTYCAGQILSTGFAPELRLRMAREAREAQPFHALIRDVESLRVEVLHGLRTPERLQESTQRLRDRLDACRAAATTVYSHFEDNGISVGLVFRLRQLRGRIVRMRELLECVLSPTPALHGARLLGHLVQVAQERRSLKAVFSANSSLLAAKVAERSAETGEHYITRTPAEYRDMVGHAAGGGAVMAFTTLAKFAVGGLALSAFWVGFWAGMNYAISFVIVQLLHFTVATKQPAMTAPAMAAKLKELDSDISIAAFVDEVTHLVRSQVAAVLGNVLVVFPAVLLLTGGWQLWSGDPFLPAEKVEYTLYSLQLLGPSVLYAAFTGVLLFSSSIVAGWAENWFVLHRLDSAIRYNPAITGLLGSARSARWGRFLRENISGLAANVSLGFMLGLVPVFSTFFGLGLDIRHVTLASGQMAAAAMGLGLEALHLPAFWWAVATLPLMGALNVGMSFYLAFRVALSAQNVSRVERSRIYAAIGARLRSHPLDFFRPRVVVAETK